MCGKMTCKVKLLMSQDYFSGEILFYLNERNNVKYNLSEVSESFILWESKLKLKGRKENIYIYIYI